MEGPSQLKILKSPSLLQYINETIAYPREHVQLKELREATAKRYPDLSIMNLPVDEGQLLSMLLKIMNAEKTIEIGVFTGYSLIVTALALPFDAHITAIDPNKEFFEFGLEFIKKAGVDHKINFIQSDAFLVLDDLINRKEEGTFDFAFVDALKDDYLKYHEQVMKLVKVGGVIAYDNTLWFGTVVLDEDDETMDDYQRKRRSYVLEFNKFLSVDPRIEVSLVSIGDGLTICRRLY